MRPIHVVTGLAFGVLECIDEIEREQRSVQAVVRGATGPVLVAYTHGSRSAIYKAISRLLDDDFIYPHPKHKHMYTSYRLSERGRAALDYSIAYQKAHTG